MTSYKERIEAITSVQRGRQGEHRCLEDDFREA